MKIAVFLASVTIALSFVIGIVANAYGTRIGERFLERGEAYNSEWLHDWVTKDLRGARGYAQAWRQARMQLRENADAALPI
jgi:hypothetical protein